MTHQYTFSFGTFYTRKHFNCHSFFANKHFFSNKHCKKVIKEFHFLMYSAVYERIFNLVRIEYRILFALAKLSESNSEYYSCCKIYSNNSKYSNIQIVQNIRIVQNIQIFEYFRIICNAKMKNFPKKHKKMPCV